EPRHEPSSSRWAVASGAFATERKLRRYIGARRALCAVGAELPLRPRTTRRSDPSRRAKAWGAFATERKLRRYIGARRALPSVGTELPLRPRTTRGVMPSRGRSLRALVRRSGSSVATWSRASLPHAVQPAIRPQVDRPVGHRRRRPDQVVQIVPRDHLRLVA